MCDEGHTVDLYELFAMRQNNRNGQPDQGVCDIRHTVHSDEPFAMIEVNTNDSASQDVCDTQQTGRLLELCAIIIDSPYGLFFVNCVLVRAHSSTNLPVGDNVEDLY